MVPGCKLGSVVHIVHLVPVDANWEMFHVHPQPYGGGSNCEMSSGKIT